MSLLQCLSVLLSSGECLSFVGASLLDVVGGVLIAVVLSLPPLGVGHLLKGGLGGLCLMLIGWLYPVCVHQFV